jgi:opacity protein-like surface antigen
MLKTLIAAGSLVLVLALPHSGRAQALPTAVAKGSLQIGGGYSVAVPDYGQRNIAGFSGFATFDFSAHIGIEGDVHYIAFVTPTDLAENSYLVGPRFFTHRGRFTPYGKLLFGIGDLVIQETEDNQGRSPGSDLAYAVGGGLDIAATQHIVVRVIDFEYQHWQYGNGLTPIVATVGIAYRFR